MFTSVKMQRAPFAGSRPNGYKDRLQSNNGSSDSNNGIADRFGGDASGTTERLPNQALGDREIVDRLNNLPVDQRPFWLINAEHIEAQKNQGRPSNPTISTNPTNQNTGDIANRFGTGTAPVAPSQTNYPSVVYPIEMTSAQRQQAQQMFNNQIQQATNNNQAINSNSNPLPSQKPVAVQQTINNGGPKQIPQPVQGRPSSGYRG